jgi:alpha-glucosidase
MPAWLKDAVFYEIYPQSFYDANGDGIGDIQGITEKLGYIKDLGVNAIWLNPIYDSPFKDAGYDVRNYKLVAPRYGTNEDLARLFEEAHKSGIRILLDLVPGHTSEEHPWFCESRKAEKNAYSSRYIWTDSWIKGIPNHPYIGGESERNGVYMLNFFKCQPALNYGWGQVTEPWQSKAGSPEALSTREALKDVMRFWLDRGCDGFRVDMADSLVKDDDEDKSCTQVIWRDIRSMLDRDYPEAALVSEWSNPMQAIPGGFHMDFYLDHAGNGYNTLMRDYETEGGDHSFFKRDGEGDILRFLNDYLPKLRAAGRKGYISFLTCNHDTPRPSVNLSVSERMLAFAVLLTLPGVPFIYYGDEIGMRYLNVKSKEGGYTRTGSRTPMQWNRGKNKGFSEADPDCLYLPVDESPDAPDVMSAAADPESLYHKMREMIALRHRCVDDLGADGLFEVVYAEERAYPFVYARGERRLAVNPSGRPASVLLPKADAEKMGQRPLYLIGQAAVEDGILTMGPGSFVMY